jgi:hypothetical protein
MCVGIETNAGIPYWFGPRSRAEIDPVHGISFSAFVLLRR